MYLHSSRPMSTAYYDTKNRYDATGDYEHGENTGGGLRGEVEYDENEIDPAVLRQIEYELRRKNPDLIDKIRFAMDDRQYGVFAHLLARGIFWGAAIYASPLIIGPLITGRAIARSRLKQIDRRNMGIKPRYHLRPDDTY